MRKSSTGVQNKGRGPAKKTERAPAKQAATSSNNDAAYAVEMQEAAGNTQDWGEVYEGEYDSEGRRHGKGTLTWANGNQYTGEWSHGRMTGTAVFTYTGQGGDVYQGSFLEDKKDGHGKYTFANGNTYTGLFKNDKRHGDGEYHWVCGDMYTGEWKEGKMHGKGTTTYANGNKYVGCFVEDKRDGQGRLVCVDGLMFDGEWRNNMRNGFGVLTFHNGDSYQGEWKQDMKDGKGLDVFVNGNKFEGHYKANVKSGLGVMTFVNGDQYSGNWEADAMHGKGIYKFSNGYVYDGNWENDSRHGKGVYKYNNSVYDGNWKDDKRNGIGTLTIDDGNEVYTGEWRAGKMEGKFEVVIQKPVKISFVGDWKGGQPCGHGTYTWDSGLKFSGNWMDLKKPAKGKTGEAGSGILPIPVPLNTERGEQEAATTDTVATRVADIQNQSDEYQRNQQMVYIEQLQRENQHLQTQLTHTQETKENEFRDKDQLSKLNRSLKQLQLKADESGKKASQAQKLIDTLQEERSKQSADGDKVRTLLQHAQKQNNEIKKQLQNSNSSNQTKSTEMQTKIDQLNKELNKLRAEKAEQRTKEREKEEKKKQQPQDPKEEPKKVVDKQVKELQSKNYDYEQQISKLALQVQSLEEDRENLKKTTQDMEARLHQLHESSEKEKDELSASLAEKDEIIKNLQSKLTDNGHSNSTSITSNDNTNDDMSQLQTNLQALQEQLTKKESEYCQNIRSMHTDYGDKISLLEKEIEHYKSELDEVKHQKGDMQSTMLLLDDLTEAKNDAEEDLKFAKKEITNLKDDLSVQKKLRKRAEKLASGSNSTEALQNEIVHLKYQLEQANNRWQEMKEELEANKTDRLWDKYNTGGGGGGGGGGSSSKNGDKSSYYQHKLEILEHKNKELLLQLQAKEKVVAERNNKSFNNTTSLEAQLQAAQDKIKYLESNNEAEEIKELSKLYSAQSQMTTRHLIGLKNGERVSELQRIMNASRSGSMNSSFICSANSTTVNSFSMSRSDSLDGCSTPSSKMNPKPPSKAALTKPPSRNRSSGTPP